MQGVEYPVIFGNRRPESHQVFGAIQDLDADNIQYIPYQLELDSHTVNTDARPEVTSPTITSG